ncbi:hypothetical protein AQ616_09435 [Oceanobacillus sp. E9]|uniref:hypothetical protein n=1 Tax=Oceanobacillus sp. E9 TaxID=1742575 RepID=UPI00084E758B|nr:hypothetical protein [Oceanobacillus sp. E9]OEH54000.1 hypothetical protein AQ616_09435 [Oceanobacillus sp. E9]
MDFLNAVLPLIGVVVGGIITYLTQTKHHKDNELKKERSDKLRAYNEILRLEAYSPLIYPTHHYEQKEFAWKLYEKNSRNILFKNLHLFDEEIIKRVLKIDGIFQKIEAVGIDEDELDSVILFDNYNEIIKYIIKDYENLIKSPD